MTDQDHIKRQLILKLKTGEKEAFRELFNMLGPKIYRFALAYLKNKSDAEDIMHDVFLKIWEKRDHIDTSQNVKAYIFKIAINSIYDFIRKKNLEKAFADFTRENFQPGDETLWNKVIWNDMLSKLNPLVEQMPEQRKTIFLMSREEGLSNQQIADKLSLSKRTVENQLYRATQYLKEHMNTDTVFLLLILFLYT
ncbi:MAG: RNA polymerase sigma-70 factor [Bacteroidales bacterium]|nr:RNA polymerase sigma-70 factor [Bacteroidales bacterium]